MKRAYETLLRLYPADYRARFAAEMLDTFEKAAEESPAQRPFRLIHFAFAELMGLLIGAASEWIAKLTTDRSVRGRCLPDLRMMRPPGIPQTVWFAGPYPGMSQACAQDEMAEAEKRIATVIGQMVHAIANHDFPKARFYSYQEREAREQLQRLRELPGVRDCPGTIPPLD